MDGKPQREGTIFIGGVDSSRHNVNILVRQLEEGSVGRKVKKAAGKGFIFNRIFPALYPFWSWAWKISIMKKQNSNQNVEGWKDGDQNVWPLPSHV